MTDESVSCNVQVSVLGVCQSLADEGLTGGVDILSAYLEEAVILATTIYSVEIMAEMAKDMEKVSEENTISLSYDKGKWLIVG